MSTADLKQKTFFLNGVEVNAIVRTGNAAKDWAAAQKLLATYGVKPRQRLTLHTKLAHAWRK